MGLANLLIRGVGITLGAQIGARIAHRIRPRPYPAPLRDLLDHPALHEISRSCCHPRPVRPGTCQTVLDLGCGTGTFTVEMARQVGSEGRVHAVDIQASMLDAARAKVEEAGFSRRVHLHHCGAYNLPLERDSVDVCRSDRRAFRDAAAAFCPGRVARYSNRAVVWPSAKRCPTPDMCCSEPSGSGCARWAFATAGCGAPPFATACSIFNDE